MNKFYWSAFALLLCLLGTFLSCSGEKKVAANTIAPTDAEVFNPDMRFASLDSLVDYMMEEFSSITVDEFVNRYEQQAVAVKSYGFLNHKGEDHCSSHHLYLVRLLGKTREETNKVIEQMAERGIATNVHYKPLPMMTAYKALGFDLANYPNAYHLFENEITLPLHTKLTDEDVEYVITNFVEIIKNH